jgi:hypothetical protein
VEPVLCLSGIGESVAESPGEGVDRPRARSRVISRASMREEIRRRGGSRLTTTWHPGGDGPEGFYLKLGFRPTGETSGEQRVGELAIA